MPSGRNSSPLRNPLCPKPLFCIKQNFRIEIQVIIKNLNNCIAISFSAPKDVVTFLPIHASLSQLPEGSHLVIRSLVSPSERGTSHMRLFPSDTHTHPSPLQSAWIPRTVSSPLLIVYVKGKEYQVQKKSTGCPDHVAEKETGTFTRKQGHSLLKAPPARGQVLTS